jgi:hypothetical protein
MSDARHSLVCESTEAYTYFVSRIFPPYPPLETVPCEIRQRFAAQGAVMVNKSRSIRLNSDGKPPSADGNSIENEILLGLPPEECAAIFHS